MSERTPEFYLERHRRRHGPRAKGPHRISNSRHHGSNLWELLYRDIGRHLRLLYVPPTEEKE